MKRLIQTFPVIHFTQVKQQLLSWASGYSSCCFLDNNGYVSDFHTHECLVAAGVQHLYSSAANGQALTGLQQFADAHQGDWLFGHLSYHLRHETESFALPPPQLPGFADVQFFVPQVVVRLQLQQLTIESYDIPPAAVWDAISKVSATASPAMPAIRLQPVLDRPAYLRTIRALQQHIQRGDCYEINFCQPFFAEAVSMDPVPVFRKLTALSPMPFACFYRQQQQYLLCASPERFLQKEGDRIRSQPMKGTAARYPDPAQDQIQISLLQNSGKERSENVMIADLVRNDLSRICREGTVQAEALFSIQTYPQVHQMISTISGLLRQEVSFTDILRATFPMGSMTGAPKKRVMELIDQYEPVPRGLFSGAVGYMDPEGNFDFNVVIRSLLYNAASRHLQYFAGSAITFYSQPEQEYEECLLKTKAVRTVLEG